ncbi:type II secretion system protein N [Aerosakkonema funiforme]|uniref:type II secretion system protein N n=1 Tax=Aerosakkonema funiforme TaxID=1246630 RepID=UPI0035B9922A
MSEDANTKRIALKPSEEQTPVQPWSMDKSADRLMDDVFADVDRMLETGTEPAARTAEPEYVSLQQMSIPQIVIPAEMVSRQVEASDDSDGEAQKSQERGRSLNKLLLGAAIASLAITLLLWLAGQGRFNRLLGINSASVEEAKKLPSEADAQFVDYMQQSLDLIEQQTEENQQVAAVPAAPQVPANSLVPVPIPGNLPQNGSRPQNAPERIYIPVYPRPQVIYANPPAPPAIRPVPTVTVTATAVAKPSPTVTVTATAVAKPSPTVTASSRPTAKASPKARATVRPTAKATPTVAAVLRSIPLARPKATPTSRPTANSSPTVAATSRPTPTPSAKVAATVRPTAQPSPTVAATARSTAKPSPTVAATTIRPTATPSATVVATTRPNPTPSARVTATAVPTATPSARVTAAAVPTTTPSATVAPSPLPAPALASPIPAATLPNPAPQRTSRQETRQASASTPAIEHTLTGLLVLGEKSAAIFEINGASRRVHLGESIGSSGWTLVEVNNNEAVIRRNGEVRSVFVGQQF